MNTERNFRFGKDGDQLPGSGLDRVGERFSLTIPGMQGRFGNRLLDRLPAEVQSSLRPKLTRTRYRQDQVLHECGQPVSHVTFPTTCIVALVSPFASGVAPEIGLIGIEGLVEVALSLGSPRTAWRSVAQCSGHGFELPVSAFRETFGHSEAFRNAVLRFAQVMFAQIAQNAACSLHHSIEQRICRRLLLSLDRLRSDDMFITQESIANFIGTRRETVSIAAGRLRDAGLIDYSRGHIHVIDRSGLESRACECYVKVRNAYTELL